jgi:hypothetical protein
MELPKAVTPMPSTRKRSRRKYQRELMRKRRAQSKAAKAALNHAAAAGAPVVESPAERENEALSFSAR